MNLDTAVRLAHGITRQGAKAIIQGHLPLIRRNQKEKELRGRARFLQYKAKVMEQKQAKAKAKALLVAKPKYESRPKPKPKTAPEHPPLGHERGHREDPWRRK
eukprot:13627964-Heterocapsa_arctica.AAC.1